MKKRIKNWKNIIIGGLFALASISPIKANALDGHIRYIHPIESPKGDYVELNTFYKLPFEINGFSWGDMYQGGDGYFGETNLEREVINGFNIKSQVQHNNTPINRVGFGISRQVPTPKGTFFKLSAFPIWYDREGRQKNTSEVAYFGEARLPYGFTLESFGDWNLADTEGVQWGYGELDLGRVVAKGVRLSYNPALLNKGDVIPRIENRVAVRINF